MPKNTLSNPFLKIDPADLAYAVQRLVQDAKTNEKEVRALVVERAEKIAKLETRLDALKSSIVMADDPSTATKSSRSGSKRSTHKRTGMKSSKVAVNRRRRGSKKKTSKRKRAAQSKTKKSRRKALASRRRQARYLKLRRSLTKPQQQRASRVAQSKGVGEALNFIATLRAKARKKAGK